MKKDIKPLSVVRADMKNGITIAVFRIDIKADLSNFFTLSVNIRMDVRLSIIIQSRDT